jgi:cathepsin D
VDFDTGSSDLLLPALDCDSTCDGHKLYDPSASSTSSDVGKTFIFQYTDAADRGKQYADNVTLAGSIVDSWYVFSHD